MHERYFFDIPVFRCNIDIWSNEQEEEINNFAKRITPEGKEISTQEVDFARKWLGPKSSHYYYGEMVGVIRLFAINMQIRGELWFVKERVSKKLKKKTWHLADIKIFEFWVHVADKNEEVFSWILSRLKEENKQWILKSRYIDLEAFENSGEYINYFDLANFSKSNT